MTHLLLQTDSSSVDWPQAMIAVGGLAIVTIIGVVVVWQIFLSWRAKMSLLREETYRWLSETSAESLRDLSDQQHRMTDNLATVSQRLANIERISQQVD